MKLIFETCQPRADVLSGELREEMFAAHLRDVIDEKADPIYRDPEVFFEHSYPTDGMVSLLRGALGRLSGVGPTNASIIRLETSFGGGKTHNLIGLYHAARRGSSAGTLLSRFVDADLLPSAPVTKIAGVVGSDLDPVNGLDHGDATTYTVWGEIAYQIGGVRGYDLIKKSDEALVAPGVQVFEKLIGDSPALIMLDEFAAFLRKADGVPVGNTTLAEQSTTFLLSLLSFAAKMQSVVVVITLADSKDAFASETDRVQAALIEAGKISARQEAIITPTNEREIAPIVVHRLFQSVDPGAALEAGQAYRDYYEEQIGKGVELPEQAIRAEYRDEIATNYPFSPELITTLNRKTSTIPDFQRTRGALRLLASVVRRIWEERPRDAWLIHSHHIDLGTESILNELTSRLKRPQYRQVVEADIASPLQGSTAHATEVDRPLVAAGRPPYARRFGTTVFLHSIVQGVASGVEPSEALLAVLAPSDDPGHVQKAMDGLLDRAWFLDYDGRRYRFKTEPSLNKLVADEMEIVGRLKPKEELNRRIRNVWRKGVFKPVYFPTEAAEVDDDAKEPKLVLVHYDAATVTVENQKPPDLVAKIFDHAGTLQGYRTYRNNVLFLLADADQVERMVEVARRHYAINRIITDDDRMSEFSEEQRKKLRGMLEEAELQYRVAITKAYRFLFYPSADAAEESSRLASETLPAQDQGNVEQDQTQAVLRVLRQLDKVLTGEDKPLPSAYVKAKAWPAGKNYSTTSELSRAFAQRLGLRILLDPNQLKKTIRDGCKLGTWVYQAPGESRVYGPPSPIPMVEISEDALLYTPDEAEKIGLPVIGEEKPTCPVCDQPADQCICDKVCPKCGQDPCACAKSKKDLRGDGAPAQAFQQVLDSAADQKITRIKRLFVKVEGTGKEAANDTRLMGLAIPQLGSGTFAIEQSIDCEFGPAEKYQGVFSGSWDRYKQVKTLTDAFGKVAEKVRVNMQLRAQFEAGLDISGDQFQTIREVFGTLGFGRLQVAAEAVDEENE
jgi:predicted AAA+ superfamily ATPase